MKQLQLHLAPLKNISCWAFRASALGATDSYTHMINLRALLSSRPNALNIVDTYPIPDQNQWIQILTNNVRDIARLPSFLNKFCENNPDLAHIHGVCINLGCPDPSIIAAGEGAALIKRTKRVKDLIMAFLNEPKSHPFHINCKFRLGLNEREMKFNKIIDLLEVIKSMEDPRLAPPIIHFKHAQQSSQEQPYWEVLEDIFNLDIPIILNGHISTPMDVKDIKNKLPHQKWESLVAGVMIGRGAIKNLDCFQDFVLPKNNREEQEWQVRFSHNIKKHPPLKQFISNYKRLYPFLFEK